MKDTKSFSLPKDLLTSIEQTAVEAVRAAGNIAGGKFGGPLEISQKAEQSGADIVSDADKKAQRVIESQIISKFPDHVLLGEEDPPDTVKTAADFLWAIDPIDGTKNFVNGSPAYAVSVGALYMGEPIAGAVWIPWPSGENSVIVHARLGGGAWLNDARLHIENEHEKPYLGRLASLPGRFSQRYQTRSEMRKNMGEVRLIGSTSYEMCLVATNTLQYALSGPAHTWDFAAGIIIINEAGGTTLFVDEKGRFAPKRGWSEGYTNDEATYKRLRRWLGPVVGTSSKLAVFIQSQLKMKRVRNFQRMRSRILNTMTRRRGKER